MESLVTLAARIVRQNWHELVESNGVGDAKREEVIRIVFNEWKLRNKIPVNKSYKLLSDVLKVIQDRREQIDYARYTHHHIYRKLCTKLGFHYEHINKRIQSSYSKENDSRSYNYSADNGSKLSTCSAQAIFFCKPKAWKWEFSESYQQSLSEEQLWLNAGVI